MPSILEKYDSFVKEQIAHNDRAATKFRHDDKRAQSYLERGAMFRQMLAEMELLCAPLPVAPLPDTSITEANFRLTQEEIKDLPQALLDQLSLTDSDKKDFLIVEIIDELGGATSLDKLLIAIYRRTGEVEKRSRLNSRLYRMANKKMVFAHPTRKGIYGRTPFPDTGEQAMLFGEDDGTEEDEPNE
ncbi:hypothetical protein [Duganella sp. Dugasp56]|uniref:hypothetical protein n=1 Tax=Duganella sp. Dugasp56 TaxID=3243046 RepID=UPI0039AF4D23